MKNSFSILIILVLIAGCMLEMLSIYMRRQEVNKLKAEIATLKEVDSIYLNTIKYLQKSDSIFLTDVTEVGIYTEEILSLFVNHKTVWDKNIKKLNSRMEVLEGKFDYWFDGSYWLEYGVDEPLNEN